MELEELSVVEKAAMLSGGSEWDSRGNDRADIPSFVMSDGPHGVRRQLGEGDHLGIGASKPATCFPTAGTVANSWDPALAEEMGEALGSEAHDLDVNVLLGPGLNIKRNPLCGRNFEYYSEDPIVAGRMAAGLIRGIQSNGISACPKHFAVNSQELRRQASNSVVDERTMRELYLTGFEIAVREAKPLTIMTSYNEINGVYAHENKHLLQEILRDEWGFDGMVVSDWGGSNSAVAAVKAGGSLEMPSPGFTSVRELEGALQQVIAHARFNGIDISIDQARTALHDLIHSQNEITVQDIQKKVADYYKIRVADMHSKRRPRVIAYPRQIAMYLSKKLTQKSYPEIGELFGGKDHTTVLHACKKIESDRRINEELNHELHVLEQNLQNF